LWLCDLLISDPESGIGGGHAGTGENRLRYAGRHLEGFVRNSKSLVPFSEQFSESSGMSPASEKK
jgi:hypothetical protein